MRQDRKKRLKKFKIIFWAIYAAVFVFFYWLVFQVKILAGGLPDDFMQMMMIVLAGSFATIFMIILGILAGLFKTAKDTISNR